MGLQRILLTTDTVGGVWSYSLCLAEGLGRAGVQVELATMGAPCSPDQREAAARVPGLRLHPSEFKLEWMEDPWEDVEAAAEWLLDLEAAFAPDLVHLNSYVHGSLPWRSPVLVVGHGCVCSWWQAVLGESAPERYDGYREGVQAGLQRAQRVVAPTRAMLLDLEQHHGPLPHGQVIPHGIDPSRWYSGQPEPFVLAAARSWDQAMNIGLLGEVAQELPWPIRVAGEAMPLTGAQGERATPFGIQALGLLPQEDLALAMSRAAIFAHPARYEPFGLSPLEAAASSCALVLSDIPNLREIWADAALYVSPDEPAAWVDALRQLARDPVLQRTMADAARARSRLYTIERMVEAYLGLYQEMLDGGPGHPSGHSGRPEAGASFFGRG